MVATSSWCTEKFGWDARLFEILVKRDWNINECLGQIWRCPDVRLHLSYTLMFSSPINDTIIAICQSAPANSHCSHNCWVTVPIPMSTVVEKSSLHWKWSPSLQARKLSNYYSSMELGVGTEVHFIRQPVTGGFNSLVSLSMLGMISMLFLIMRISSRIPPNARIDGHRFMELREMDTLNAFASCLRCLQDMTTGIQMTWRLVRWRSGQDILDVQLS